MRRSVTAIAGMALVTSAFIVAQPGAQALPPLIANDNFADATVITSIPFTEATSNALATIETDEPQACGSLTKTLWYRYTPTSDGIISLGSTGGMTTSVFLGTTLADLRTAACSEWGAYLPVFAGTTYHVQIGADSASTSFTVSANAVSGIAGRVTETSGAPVRNYCIQLYDADGSWDDASYTSDRSSYQHQVAEEYEGMYIFFDPTPGTKKIEFGCGEGLFEDEW
ncbi:MAG TPA: hypothetical protein VI541_05215, partial [Actinomycetota bacterium]|nr:hypothetical protein [Actinomycetota bacterium]